MSQTRRQSRTELAIRELLDAADDPDHAEHPPGFDWGELRVRVVRLQPALERIAGRPFVLDDRVEDASFFADLSIQTTGERPNWIDTVFAFRFSTFGDLFTTWSHGRERLPEAVNAELVDAVRSAGFRFIPPEVLHEPYTGRYPGFCRSTWWMRFFDYL